MLNRQKKKIKFAEWIALEIEKYGTNEKLTSANPVSHKTKNVGWLRPDRLWNTVTAHAPRTKLKNSDMRKTLEAFIKDPQQSLNWKDTSVVQKNCLI